jgi:hypothetical protein
MDWNAIAAVAQTVATFVAACALIYTVRQTSLNRQAIQAQTFVTVVNTARTIRFSRGMDRIRALRFGDYDTFRDSTSPEVQRHVREVVDFLNDVGHMLRHGYLTRQHVLNIYCFSILDCSERLLPWWLEGFRREHGGRDYYENFQLLVDTARRDG